MDVAPSVRDHQYWTRSGTFFERAVRSMNRSIGSGSSSSDDMAIASRGAYQRPFFHKPPDLRELTFRVLLQLDITSFVPDDPQGFQADFFS